MLTGRLETRWMVRRDLITVVSIEEQLFNHPWSAGDFLRYLRGSTTIGRVAVWNDGETESVIGYLLYEIREQEIVLNNLAVAECVQRCGIGTKLMARPMQRLDDQRQRLVCYVSEENLPGQLFLQSLGFVCDEIRGDFFDNGEKAYRFILRTTWLTEAVA